MEKYTLHMRRDVFDRVVKCINAHIDANKWLPVKALGDLMEVDLSGIFGNGNLGWSPSKLFFYFKAAETSFSIYISMPKPEEIPDQHTGCTVRDCMEELAGHERPTLKDWLNKSGTHKGADPFEKVCVKDALAILRRLVENGYSLYPELVEQLTEMRTLIHTLIGTGKNFYEGEEYCEDDIFATKAVFEAVHKSTRLDSMDALSYAVRAMLANKGMPGVKAALNSIYGIATYDGARIDNALKSAEQSYVETITNVLNGNPEEKAADNGHLHTPVPENVRADEPNALFVTIETGAFEVTPENVGAVSAFISDAGEGRDIHIRII